MTRRPTTLKVGLYTYRLRWWRRKAYSSTCFAFCDSDALEIHLPTVQPRERVREFLWHEVLHALWHSYGLGEAAKEEKVATCLGRGIAALFADNVWLKEWV